MLEEVIISTPEKSIMTSQSGLLLMVSLTALSSLAISGSLEGSSTTRTSSETF